MQSFVRDCLNKFYRVIKEKNRSPFPWNDHSFEFLFSRLRDEFIELENALDAFLHNKGSVVGVLDECMDVALFVWFIWVKAVFFYKDPVVVGENTTMEDIVL